MILGRTLKASSALCGFGLALFGLGANGDALANPQGGDVVGGSAHFSQDGKKFNIHQNSNKVVINWQSFDIAVDEHTQFYQPSSSSIALNRVLGADPSHILGRLSANGNVILVNPSGVFFGAQSVVDVNSLIATTIDIDTQDFMDGRFDFNKPGLPDAKIVNHGTITAAQAGLVGLVAPQVENHGVIVANMGRVELASGEQFTVDFYGDGLLSVALDRDIQQRIVNTGTLQADGGTVALTAAQGRTIIDSVMDIGGVVQTQTVEKKNGRIIISAAGSNKSPDLQGKTKVNISGKIDATGHASGDQGGTITITADMVRAKPTAQIVASGDQGGGEILIGGDYLGGNEGGYGLDNAHSVFVDGGAIIDASALTEGDGGRVILWADHTTDFAGSIFAQGGINSGDGGFVETSGKINLGVRSGAVVNASARAAGYSAGHWLLDPSNVTITDGGAESIPAGGGTIDPDSDDYIIDAASITAALNSGNNVTITTNNAGGTQDGDITVTNATIEKTTANNDVTLWLQADRDIIMSNSSIISTADALNVILNSNRNETDGGVIRLTNATINTAGGDIIMGGGLDPLTGFALGGATTIVEQGISITGSYDIDAQGGNITMRGQGRMAGTTGDGIFFQGTPGIVKTSGDGTIYIHGIGGEGNNRFGVRIASASEIEVENGDLTMVGVGNATAGNARGVYMAGDSEIRSIGTGINAGNILIDSTNVGVGEWGFSMNAGVIKTIDGDISIFAESLVAGSTIAFPGSTINRIISEGAGNITLQASVTGGGSSGINFYGGASSIIGDANMTGDITLRADSIINLDHAAGHDVITQGNIIIENYEAGRTIGLGGGAGDLSISDASLARLAASGYIFGSNTSGDVTVNTTHDFGDADVMFVSGNDINLAGTLEKATGAGTVDYIFQANRNIFNSNGADILATNGAINITLNSNRNETDGGAVALTNATINTGGGNFIIGGGADPLTTSTKGVSGLVVGADLNNSQITTLAGNISVRGAGYDDATTSGQYGVRIMGGANVLTTTGDIDIRGFGGAGIDNNMGVWLNGTATEVSTISGRIDIVGTGGNADPVGTNNKGVTINSATVLSSGLGGGVGDIRIQGNGAGGASANHGVHIFAGTVSVIDADLEIVGEAIGLSGLDYGVYINSLSSILSGGVGVNAGTISLEGIKGGIGGTTLIISNTNISSQDGDISLRTNNSGAGNNSFWLSGDVGILSSGEANIDIITNNTSGNLTSINFLDGGDVTIGGATATGSIRIVADRWDNFVSIGDDDRVETAGRVTVENQLDGRLVGLGAGAVQLALTDDALANIIAGEYIFGSGTAGNITVDTGHDFGSSPVTYITGGDVIFTNAGTLGGALTVDAAGNIALNNDVTADGITFDAATLSQNNNRIIDAGEGVFTLGSGIWNAGNQNLSLLADDGYVIDGTIINVGGLTLAGSTAGLSLGVGTASVGDIIIDEDEIENITADTYIFGSNNSGDVTVNTTHDFADSDVTFISGNDINLAGTLEKATGAGTVDYIFRANRNIFNSNNAGIFSDAGATNVIINANRDSTTGAIEFEHSSGWSGSVMRTAGGDIIMGGGNDPWTEYAVGTSAGINRGIRLRGTFDAEGGVISVLGRRGVSGVSGIFLQGARLITSNNDIFIYGQSQVASGLAFASDSSSIVRATDGNIYVYVSRDADDLSTNLTTFNTITFETIHSGDINFTADGGVLSFGTNTGATSISATGNGLLISDAVEIGGGTLNMQAADTLTIRPFTDGREVTVGAAGGLSILDAFLASTSASQFVFGSDVAGDVTVNTTHDFGDADVMFVSGNDINLAGTLTRQTGADAVDYIFRANRNIFNSNDAGIFSDAGATNVIINANRDSTTGAIEFVHSTGLNGSVMRTAGGDIVMGGGNDPWTEFAVGASGDLGSGVRLRGTYDAEGGAINISGRRVVAGSQGVYLNGARLFTSNNDINIFAQHAVNSLGFSSDGNSLVRVVDGDINIEASRDIAGAFQILDFWTSNYETVGSGDISFIGNNGLIRVGNNPTSIISAGDITFKTDLISYSGAATTIDAADTLTILPFTDGREVTVGAAGELSISNDLLATMSASQFVFGSDVAGDVTVNTTHDFADADVMFVSGNDINLAGTLEKATGTGTVDYIFQANRNISNSNGADILATNGAINVTLNSNRNETDGGAVALTNATINTAGGNFIIGGGDEPENKEAAGNSVLISGVVLNAVSLDSSGGDISIRGAGSTEVNNSAVAIIGNSNLISDTGSINIYGSGISSVTGNGGVRISSSVLQASSGNIDIYGEVTDINDVGDINRAIIVSNNSTLQTTSSIAGEGNITLIGDATGSSTINGRGYEMGSGAQILTDAGNILIDTTGTQPFITWKSFAINSTNGDVSIILDDIDSTAVLQFSSNDPANDIFTIAGKNINITADQIFFNTAFNSTSSIIAEEVFTFRNSTNSQSFSIGGTTLSDLQLPFISADQYVFGSATAGNITVNTTHDFADSDVTFISGNDIDLAGTLEKATGAGTVDYTFQANRNIFNSNGADILATNGAINVTLNSNRNETDGGAVALTNATINTGGGNFIIGGGTDPITGFAEGISGFVSGLALTDTSVYTGAGDIVLRGHGWNQDNITNSYGVLLGNNVNLITSTGDIAMIGYGGTGANGNLHNGVRFQGTAGDILLETSGGDIDIRGYDVGNSGGRGVILNESVILRSLATGVDPGVIRVYGEANNHTGGTANHGVFMLGSATIDTIDADIEIIGLAESASNNNVGIRMIGSSSAAITGSGDILLRGIIDPLQTGAIGLQVTTGGDIGSSMMQGDINLEADRMNFSGGHFYETNGKISISTISDGHDLIVGQWIAEPLAFTSTMLERLNAGHLQFETKNSGNITVDTNHDFGVSPVTYITGGDVIFTDAGTLGGALTVDAAGNIALNNDVTADGITFDAATLSQNNNRIIDAGEGVFTLGSGVWNAGNQNLSLLADDGYVIDGTIINVGGLTLAGSTAGLSLGVGTASVGDIIIDEDEIENITADTYIFGSNNSGDVTVNTTHDFADSDVTFISGNDIDLAGTLEKATGAGTVDYIFQANRNIFNSNGADILATNGAINITLNSNRNETDGGAVALTNTTINTGGGDFVIGGGADPLTGFAKGTVDYIRGMLLIGADIDTAEGDISIRGEGYDDPTQSGLNGVDIRNGSVLETINGDIQISGISGDGLVGVRGVRIANNALITSQFGDINIWGEAGTVQNNAAIGVDILGGARINSTGGGATAGNIYIEGHGGDGDDFNLGVWISTLAEIESIDGDIQIIGYGGNGTGNDNSGILIREDAKIISTGIGADAGRIILNGTGGNGDQGNRGIYIHDAGTLIRSVDGDIEITGYGGIGTGNSNYGIEIREATLIESTGVGADAARIILSGTGGNGDQGNRGLWVRDVDTLIRSIDGDIEITSIGGTGTGDFNHGIEVSGGAAIESIGIGVNAARIILDGTGGGDSSTINRGVFIQNPDTLISAVDGDIEITGTGGTGSSQGVLVTDSAVIGGADADGDIAIEADSFSLASGLIQTSGAITVRNRTASTTMGIGTGAGTLSVNNGELGRLDGGAYIFGSGTAGNITVNTNHDFGVSPVTYITGGDVIFTNAGTLGGALTVDAVGNIALNNDITADGITFNAATLSQNNNRIIDAGEGVFTLGSGVWNAGNQNLSLLADDGYVIDGTIINVGALTLAGSTAGLSLGVGAASVGDIIVDEDEIENITADTYIFGSNNSGDVTVNTTHDFGDADVMFVSGNDINLAGTLTRQTGADTVDYIFRANRNIFNSNNAGIFSDAGATNVIINANRDGTTGAIEFEHSSGWSGSVMRTAGGDIIMGGGNDPWTEFAVGGSGTLEHGIRLRGTYDAEGGAINISGRRVAVSNLGVTLNGARLFTFNNDVMIRAQKAASGTAFAANASSRVEVTDGNIIIDVAQDTPTSNNLMTTSTAHFETIGSGDIVFTVDGGVLGFNPSGGSSTVRSAENITLVSDFIELGAGTLNMQAAGTLTIRPFTDGREVTVGAAGELSISNDLLATMSASQFVFGSDVTGDVTVNTTHDFGDADVTFISGNDINLAGTLEKVTGAGTVDYTFQANRNIFNSNGADILATNGAINVTLNSNRNETDGGAVALTNATINTGGGDFVIGGGADPLTGFAKGTVDYIRGVVLIGADIDTAEGDISIRGEGYDDAVAIQLYGVSFNNSEVKTSTGNIEVHGRGGAGDSFNDGIRIQTTSLLTSVSGDLFLYGRAGDASGDHNVGVIVRADSVVSTTGTAANAGNITIDGVGADGNDQNDGVRVAGADSKVETIDGNITLIGQGGDGDSFNRGIFITELAQVISSDNGNIDLHGTGGDGAQENVGVLINNNALVKSNHGDIDIYGEGDGVGTQNRGVWLRGASIVESIGSGSINIEGHAATNIVNNHAFGFHAQNGIVRVADGDIYILGMSETNQGIRFHSSDGQIISNGAGNITLEANSIGFTNSGTPTHIIGGDNASGSIKLITNNFNIQDPSLVEIKTSGSFTLESLNAGRTIGIGSAANLSLTDADLTKIIAGEYIFGSGTAGNITVDTNHDFGVSPVTYITGGDVIFTNAGTLGGALTVDAAGNIALNNDVTADGITFDAATLSQNNNRIIDAGEGVFTLGSGIWNAGNQNLSLLADDGYVIDGTIINVGGLTLAGSTAGLSLGVGTASVGDIIIDEDEIENITADTYIFGSNNSGDVTVNTTHDFGNSNVTYDSGNNVLMLNSGSLSGSLNLEAVNNLSLNSNLSANGIRLNAGTMTQNDNRIMNAGTEEFVLAAGVWDVGNFDLGLLADDGLVITGSIHDIDTLTLSTSTAGRTMGIGTGSAGDIVVNDAFIGNLDATNFVFGIETTGSLIVDTNYNFGGGNIGYRSGQDIVLNNIGTVGGAFFVDAADNVAVNTNISANGITFDAATLSQNDNRIIDAQNGNFALNSGAWNGGGFDLEIRGDDFIVNGTISNVGALEFVTGNNFLIGNGVETASLNNDELARLSADNILFETSGTLLSVNSNHDFGTSDVTYKSAQNITVDQSGQMQGALNIEAANNIVLNNNLSAEGIELSGLTITQNGNRLIDAGEGSFVLASGNWNGNNSNLSIIADDFVINDTINNVNDMSLANYSAGRSIGVGTIAAGDINISDAELSNLSVQNLQIGAADSGDVRINTAHNFGVADIIYISGADLWLENAGSMAGNLRAVADGNINVHTDITAQGIELSASDLTQNATRTINAQTGTFRLENGLWQTSGFDLNLVADQYDIVGNINSTAKLSVANATVGRSFGIGTAAGQIGLSNDELGRLNVANLEIGSATAGNINVNTVNNFGSTNVEYYSGQGNLTLTNIGSMAGHLTANAFGAINLHGDLTANGLTFDSNTISQNAARIINAGEGILNVTNGSNWNAGGHNLTLAADQFTIDETITNVNQLHLRSGTQSAILGIGSGVGDVQISQSLLNNINAQSYVIGTGNNNLIRIGAISLARNLTVQGRSIDAVGNVVLTGDRLLSMNATNGALSRSNGRLTATSINLNATSVMTADVNATNLNINNSSTSATLTGIVDGGVGQLAANKIIGGVMQNPLYTFNGFMLGTDYIPPVEPNIPSSVEVISQKPGNGVLSEPSNGQENLLFNMRRDLEDDTQEEIIIDTDNGSEFLNDETEIFYEASQGNQSQSTGLMRNLIRVHPNLARIFGIDGGQNVRRQ